MSRSLILKKEQHWYVIPETEDKEDLIRSIIVKENPGLFEDIDSVQEMISAGGWVVEEYSDLGEVA